MQDSFWRKHPILKKGIIVLCWLLAWHLLALMTDNAILLATPFETAGTFIRLLATQLFWKSVGGSLARIAAGFLLGLCAALILAVATWRFPPAEDVLSPLITLLKAVPVASFVVILLIWWGSSYLAVAICFVVVLPGIYISTLEGLKSADKELLEMAGVFRMPLLTKFFYIYRPGLKPFFQASLKLALGMCWKSGVAAELIGTPAFSIGERLYLSKIYLDTAGVFAWTTVILLMSVGFEKLVLFAASLFFAWEPSCGGAGESGTGEAANLQCRNLTKTYGEKCVFKGLNVEYEPGQTYYLREPSGSGKTTLLRVLCGLEEPEEGTVGPAMRFSYVFQEDRLCEQYSAIRNVEMVTGGRAPGCDRARAALLKLLAEEDLDRPCSQLSGGMKRRVALARAMEADSDCVLLDEPFTGMDADTRERAMSYIRERQGGRILVIATHI